MTESARTVGTRYDFVLTRVNAYRVSLMGIILAAAQGQHEIHAYTRRKAHFMHSMLSWKATELQQHEATAHVVGLLSYIHMTADENAQTWSLH